MSSSDLLNALIAAAYVLAVVGGAEWLRRRAGWRLAYTRKVIHIGVGMLSWLVPVIFTSPLPFTATAFLAAALLALDARGGYIQAMSRKGETSWGTVWFALVAGIVVWVFWDQPPVMVAILMPLVWGDGMAEVIGRWRGRRAYAIRGHRRTVEGSAAFVVFSTLATAAALIIIPGSPELTLAAAWLPALVTSIIASGVEAATPGGLDNVFVTVTAVVVLGVWPL